MVKELERKRKNTFKIIIAVGAFGLVFIFGFVMLYKRW